MFRVSQFSRLFSHNSSLSCSSLTKLKFKDLRLMYIPPSQQIHISKQLCCKSDGKKRIPSIQDCKTPNMMDNIPKPEGSWKKQNEQYRSRSRNILLLGILFTAATIGAVYYVGFPFTKVSKHGEKTKKKAESKKSTRIPPNSKDIPKDVPYVLIGAGTASFSAFRAIKSSDPKAKVLVITSEPHLPYMRPPLSKEMWYNEDKQAVKKLNFRQWNGSERSLFYEPDDFYLECKDLMESENGGVSVIRGYTVDKVDVREKVVHLDDGTTISYDKCLIATGATPKLSPVFQVAHEDSNLSDRIKLFRNIDDFNDVYDAYEKAESIAIIGGGFLGSELACSMGHKDKKRAKRIYQIFREEGNMGKILPQYLSQWTTDKVKEEGVNVLSSTEVVSVKDNPKGIQLQLNNGKSIIADFALVTVGVEPNTGLAESSDLEVDPELGGYLVNSELQARTDLYIAGDCVSFYDPRLGRRRVEHHDHAVVTGRLAGENMTGARKPYVHQSMFWSDLGPDVGYEAIGIVDSSLPTVGVFAKQQLTDTPKAVVTETGEGDRSKTEEVPEECEKYMTEDQKKDLAERKAQLTPKKHEGEDFSKGVIFYLRNDIIVGIVLWNVFNRMSVARQVLKEQKKYDDLNEVAKLFNIHED